MRVSAEDKNGITWVIGCDWFRYTAGILEYQQHGKEEAEVILDVVKLEVEDERRS